MKMLILLLFALATNIALAAKIGDDKVTIGQDGSTQDKELIFKDVNKTKLKVEHSSGNFILGDGQNNSKKWIFDQGLGASNPFLQYDSSASKIRFSNDGSLVKDLGSGSGSGGDGGVNLLSNSSFEDGVSTGWSNTGGTFTQQAYTNSIESNLNFARFVASGSGQYFQSSLVTLPDFISYGCMADFRYKDGDNAFTYTVLDHLSNVKASGSVSDLTNIEKAPTITFACSPGDQLRIRVESTGAGSIDVDQFYLGSNKGFIPSSITINSVKLSGNDGRAISANTEDVHFSGSGKGWSTGADNTPSTYTVQSSDSIVSMVGSLYFTSDAQEYIFLYKNGVAYKGISQVSVTNDSRAKFSFISSKGEFLKNDILSIRIGTNRALNNNGLYHFMNINESISSNVEAYVPEIADFKISAYIKTANSVTLPIANGGSHTNRSIISASNLVMGLKKGSAKIACDNAVSTGLDCAGNEHLGIQFDAPVSGLYRICHSFTHRGSMGYAMCTQQLANNTAITCHQYRRNDAVTTYEKIYNCDEFQLNQGENKIALLYGATGNSVELLIDNLGDGNGVGSNLEFNIDLAQNNVSRPVIQNMVDTKNKNGVTIGTCHILNNPAVGTSTPTFNSSDPDCWFISSLAHNNEALDVTFTQSGLKCVASTMRANSSLAITDSAGQDIQTYTLPASVRMRSFNDTATKINPHFSISCSANK